MGQNRILHLEPVPAIVAPAPVAFVAVPPCLMAAPGYQAQMYQWAFQQAQAAVAARIQAARPARTPDLFAVFN